MWARCCALALVVGSLPGGLGIAAANKPTVLEGLVVDADEKPVADALVVLSLRYGFGENRWTVEGQTDADGNFELSVPAKWLKPGPFYHDRTVWVYADGHAVGLGSGYKQLDGNSDEPLRIALGVAEPMTFHVVDSDGREVEGCRVEPHHWETGSVPPQPILDCVAAVTDVDGNATLDSLLTGQVRSLVVETDDYGKQRVRFEDGLSVDGVNQIALSDVGILEGRLGDDGTALVNVRIGADAHGRGNGWNEGMGHTTTDEQGRFRIAPLPVGKYQLFVQGLEGTTLRPQISDEAVVTAGDTTNVRIPLKETVEVCGQVVARGTDTPVAGAFVIVNHGGKFQSESVLTDAEGKFTAHVLPGAVRQQLIVIPKKFKAWIRARNVNDTLEVSADSSPFELPPLELAEAQKMSGKVVDLKGRPQSQVRVTALDARNQGVGFGRTDNAGRFSLTVPKETPIENYRLYVPSASMNDLARVVSESPLVLQLPHSQVDMDVDLATTPTPEDKRQPEFPASREEQATLIVAKNALLFEGSSTTWADLNDELERRAGVDGGNLETVYYYRTHGAYDDEFRTTEARNWSQMLTDTTGVSVQERGLILNQAAERYDALEIADVWPPGADEPIKGRVVDAEGRPVPDAQVVLLIPPPPTSRFGSGQNVYLRNGQVSSPTDFIIERSNEDGTFEFDFPVARTNVMALAPQGFALVAASTDGTDIVLAPWSRVTGTIPQTKETGVQTMSLSLSIRPSGSNESTDISMSSGSPSNPTEAFEFLAVPSGQTASIRRTVWKESEQYGLMGNSQGKPFKLETEPGMTHHLEFRLAEGDE